MKRNGAGLASICILSIMVLVLISAPATLLMGNEEALNNRFPRDFISTYRFGENLELLSDDNISVLRGEVEQYMEENNVKPLNLVDYRTVSISGTVKGDEVIFDYYAYTTEHGEDLGIYSSLSQVYMIPLDDYNRMMGTSETLANDEVLLYPYRTDEYPKNNIYFQNAGDYKIKKVLDDCFVNGNVAVSTTPTLFFIIPDIEEAAVGFGDQKGEYLAFPTWEYSFDVDADKDAQENLFKKFGGLYNEEVSKGQFEMRSVSWREGNRENFFSTYGGLFYLDLVLSIVFIFGALLIIYYKQISEGYKEILDEMTELIVDTVCTNKTTIRISGDDKSTETVKSRFLKLNSEPYSICSQLSERQYNPCQNAHVR